ncbi:hypothetical protein [Saccharothrix hoggarensis]|uniref:ATP-grasp target RiPP n=1 Tax=Saccharothrix hoggarensis TaxID=913853 RepID=A0ABW3R2E2_9PSEU
MNATPPGVDELEPVDVGAALDGTEVLTVEPAAPTNAVTDLVKVKEDPLVGDTPPATPTGHHQTHSVPVDVTGTQVSTN